MLSFHSVADKFNFVSVKINNVVNSFEDAVAKFPDCVETYALFAQILCDQSQFDRAEELYVKVCYYHYNRFCSLGTPKYLIKATSQADKLKQTFQQKLNIKNPSKTKNIVNLS